MTSVTHRFVILVSRHFSYPFACRCDKRYVDGG